VPVTRAFSHGRHHLERSGRDKTYYEVGRKVTSPSCEHIWERTTRIDSCHASVTGYVCIRCRGSGQYYWERDVRWDPSALASLDPGCQRCREILRGDQIVSHSTAWDVNGKLLHENRELREQKVRSDDMVEETLAAVNEAVEALSEETNAESVEAVRVAVQELNTVLARFYDLDYDVGPPPESAYE